MALDDFCWAFASRFKKGGARAGVSPVTRARISILVRSDLSLYNYLTSLSIKRRFTFENQHIVNAPDDCGLQNNTSSRPPTPATPGVDTPTTPGPERPPKRKRVDGRPLKGHDYWSAVDTWFRTKTALWGNQWNAPMWEEYVSRCCNTFNTNFSSFISYISSTLEWDRSQFASTTAGSLSMSGVPFPPQPGGDGPMHPSGPSTSLQSTGMAGILDLM